MPSKELMMTQLTALTPHTWRSLVASMGHAFKHEPPVMPTLLKPYACFVDVPFDWHSVKSAVNSRRMRARKAAMKKTGALKRYRRRVYMRSYMRVYRREQRT